MTSEEVRNSISLHRTQLMGFAIIFIMVGHLRFFQLFDYGDFNFIASMGSCGVDIFLFLSSFGLFYSFEKSQNLWRYYCRRFIRIVPTYVTIMLFIDIVTRNFHNIISPNSWVTHLFSNWFIPFICLMYLIFPLMWLCGKKWLYLPLIIACCATAVLTFVLVKTGRDDISEVPMLMAQRLPIFALGMLAADKRANWRINRPLIWLILVILSLYIGVWRFGLSFLKYLLFFPLAYLLIATLSSTPQSRTNTTLTFFGEHSLEIYLLHMFLMPKMRKYNIDPYLTVFVCFSLSALGAWLIKKILTYIFSKLKIT